MLESQVQTAERMYGQRAPTYEDSWHPDYSRRFMEHVHIKSGDRILDLACGTGLDAVIAAQRVGDGGIVVGVDVTASMLEVAKGKQKTNLVLARRLKLVQHDATDLSGCEGVERGSFDLVICSNAFVLFEHPERVVAHWREYLKPGGKMIIDITHENSMRSGVLMERASKRLNIPFPSNRLWIKSVDSFREILESEGFSVERVASLEKVVGEGTYYLGLDEADQQFDYVVNGPLAPLMITDELKEKGRPYFKEEWEKVAVDGKVEYSDILYVYIARKT